MHDKQPVSRRERLIEDYELIKMAGMLAVSMANVLKEDARFYASKLKYQYRSGKMFDRVEVMYTDEELDDWRRLSPIEFEHEVNNK